MYNVLEQPRKREMADKRRKREGEREGKILKKYKRNTCRESLKSYIESACTVQAKYIIKFLL